MSRIDEIEARLAKATPDCGDHSCLFALNRSGMRTNGGCQCYGPRSLMRASPAARYAVAMHAVRQYLLAGYRAREARMQALEAVAAAAREYADRDSAFNRNRLCDALAALDARAEGEKG